MGDRYAKLEPATLWDSLRERTRSALACGALLSIETEQCFMEDGGMRFLVRSVSSLRRKARREDDRGADFNPFLPPEPELTLGAIGGNHLGILNKFNVLEHHLLIVTRQFKHQETLLDRDDFLALQLALQGIDGLGFYNGGAAAGASQNHKHLQLVPLPLTPDGPDLPLEAVLAGVEEGPVPALPFAHAFRRLPSDLWQRPEAAGYIHLIYREMLEQLGIAEVEREGEPRQSAPYNLLLRRGWMLLVPRRQEHFEGISVNALGFAGSLFVRTPQELEQVARTGPLRILAGVAGI